MRHRESGLYALTSPLYLNVGALLNPREAEAYLKSIEFHVTCISTDIVIRPIQTQTSVSFFDEFSPIDATPSYVHQKEQSIKDFKLFTPMVKTKEIIMGPQNVNEALDFLLKLQDPKQKEIREARRAEKDRQETRQLLSGDDSSNEEFVAQLVLVK